MQKEAIETKHIALAGLATAVKDDDRRCVYLIDLTGNAYTFFKYKGKLIDVASLITEVSIGKIEKADAVEQIRKGLAYGIKQGQVVVFHIGEGNLNVDEFLKGSKFWNPVQLFRSPQNMSDEWYRENVMMPTDKDIFGNEGSLFPSEKYIIYVSVTKNIPYESIAWLKGTEKNFKGLTID